MTPLLVVNFLGQVETSTSTEGNAPGPLFWICYLAVLILLIASIWKVFSKAGQPGWAVLIPIYNAYVLCKVAGRPGWWVILLLIPFVNFVIAIILCLDVAKAFGKGGGFAVGLLLLPFIFYPILGFGSAQYTGARPAVGPGPAVATA
jgi:ABC-type sulfate transport system permease subunit